MEVIRLVDVCHQLQALGGFAGVVQTSFEVRARIVGVGLSPRGKGDEGGRGDERGAQDERRLEQRDATGHWVGLGVSVFRMACIRPISARCPASTSVANENNSGCWPEPGVLKSLATMSSAPSWCLIIPVR